MSDDADETLVWVPLFDFRASDRDYELAPGLVLRRLREMPDVGGQEKYLPEIEQILLPGVSHWLQYQHSPDSGPSAAEVSNLVLLALWLVEPTRTHVRVRFLRSLTDEKRKQLQHSWHHFQWIEGAVQDAYSDEQMSRAASLYELLLAVRLREKRLCDALQLTLNGCMAFRWQVPIICHAAAFETLLTCSKDNGLVQRLCSAYACLIETEIARRNRAYREAEFLYDCRSDIMHGRMSGIPKDRRLARVKDIQSLLRRLWVRILTDKDAVDALEGSDALRRAFLDKLMFGFTAPGHRQ